MSFTNYLGPIGYAYNKLAGNDTGSLTSYLDPADLFNKQAGEDVKKAGQQAQAYLAQLSDTSWQRQMTGLQRALGSMNNYNGVLSNLYGVPTNYYDPNGSGGVEGRGSSGGVAPGQAPMPTGSAPGQSVPIGSTTPINTLPSRGANSTSPSSMPPQGPQLLPTRVGTGTSSVSPSVQQVLPGRGATGAGVATPPAPPVGVSSGVPGSGSGIDPGAILAILGQMAVAPATGPAAEARSGRGHF